MPLHSITQPTLGASDLWWGFIDAMVQQPILFGVLIITACIVLVKLCFLIDDYSRDRAIKAEIAQMEREARERAEREARQLKVFKSIARWPNDGGRAA